MSHKLNAGIAVIGIRSAPSYWSVPLPCGKACASCALSYHAFSPRPAMPCRPACCASSRIWQGTGAGCVVSRLSHRSNVAEHPPVFFLFALHRRSRRVLPLEPIRRAPGA